MSSHFNYEIDERSLRVKLKDMTLPYKEDAWTQFENYADEHCISQKRTALPSFQFNINRTLILPFVFGGVIIGFSLLLFNFISIKNKPEEALSSNKMSNEPKKDERVAMAENKEMDTAKTLHTDTVAEAKTDTIKAPVTTPVNTVATVVNTVEVKPVPTPTVAAVAVNPPAGSWTSAESLQVYESPNIASKVVGTAGRNQTYTALEETNYFIKITLDGGKTGFVRKHLLTKNNGSGARTMPSNSNPGGRKKQRSAEVLESIQTPVMTTSSDEKEPELK